MATLKEVQGKIGSIKKTRQITKAMNMVAASRLRGAQLKMEAFRPYAEKFGQVLSSLSERLGEDAHPLLMEKEEAVKAHIIIMTSDRGLCGGFNNNLITELRKLIDELKAKGREVTLTAFGKRAKDWAKTRGFAVDEVHLGVVGANFGFEVASTAGDKLIKAYLTDTADEVYMIYSSFISMGRQVPTVQQILPIPPLAEAGGEDEASDAPEEGYMPEHICEPSADALLGELLPKNIHIQVYKGLLETSAAEHAARMTAMDNATKACNDLLEDLTLAYNKARQAAITTELMDIVGGAEALKG